MEAYMRSFYERKWKEGRMASVVKEISREKGLEEEWMQFKMDAMKL